MMPFRVNGTCVPISVLVLGPIENNVYIVDDGMDCGAGHEAGLEEGCEASFRDGCFVVDPSCHADRILEAIGERTVHAIVITHGHFDHTGAAAELREATGAPVIASAADAPLITGEGGLERHRNLVTPCVVDRTVADGDTLEIGNTKWQVIATPGHTPGGLCFFLEPADDQQGAPVLLSGDTLFAGTHGRTDFPESDPAAMRTSLKRLAELPEETIVLPGHNAPTTIGREKRWLERGGIVR